MVMSMIALSAGIFSALIGILMITITVRLFMQYFKKKNIAGLYLTLSVLAYTLTIWSAFITYVFGDASEILILTFQILIYVFIFIGTMLSFLFASNIFFESKRIYTIIYILIGVAAILIIAFTNSNVISYFPDNPAYRQYTIKPEYSIILVVYIIPTAIGIFWVAWRVSNKVDSEKDRNRFRLIAIAQLMIPIAFVFDTLSSVFYTSLVLYALFLNLTWVPPAIAAICYDRGWIIRKDK